MINSDKPNFLPNDIEHVTRMSAPLITKQSPRKSSIRL